MAGYETSYMYLYTCLPHNLQRKFLQFAFSCGHRNLGHVHVLGLMPMANFMYVPISHRNNTAIAPYYSNGSGYYYLNNFGDIFKSGGLLAHSKKEFARSIAYFSAQAPFMLCF